MFALKDQENSMATMTQATDAAAKGGKATVYYSEEGGKKVAHFFEKL